MRLMYHKCRRLTADTAELECMAWDVLRKAFYIDLPLRMAESFVIPFIPNIRN